MLLPHFWELGAEKQHPKRPRVFLDQQGSLDKGAGILLYSNLFTTIKTKSLTKTQKQNYAYKMNIDIT